ncbi:Hydrogenosomal carrier protein [Aphanomyces cochlioides]|nr:Hydrogenosomal carrier protein [Aphanomyces cochlioides]
MTTHQTSSFAPSLAMTQWHSVAAGFFAGCVTKSTTSPLDVLKVLFQTKHLHRGSIHKTGLHLYAENGIRGFWKGNFAGCCRLGPYSGIKFCLFDHLQSRHGDAPTSAERAASGAVAGMVATIAVYPMELIRTHLIVSNRAATINKVCANILRTEGLFGFYRGCFSGLVGAIPFEGIQFACYEYGKHYAMEHRWLLWDWPENKTQLHTCDHLTLGSLSGALAQMVAYPFDTIKKRLQIQAKGGVQYKGLLDCFFKVIRDEGALALYGGSLPNLIRIIPYGAVMFASYEAAKDFLKSL